MSTTNKDELTLAIEAITGLTETAPGPTEPTKPKPNKRTLYFRLIVDDRLDLGARIILSYIWKWQDINQGQRKRKGLPPKKIDLRRLRDATGFRPATIKSYLSDLRAWGFLLKSFTVTPEHPSYITKGRIACSYRKLEWYDDEPIRPAVFHAFVRSNEGKRKRRAAWYVKALGIPRPTYYRWLKKPGVTDETVE